MISQASHDNGKRFNIYLDAELHSAAAKCAFAEHISFSSMVAALLRKELKRQGIEIAPKPQPLPVLRAPLALKTAPKQLGLQEVVS